MSYSNGLLNFKNQTSSQGERGKPGVGFNLTSDGNYDMSKKKVTIGKGTSNSDAITKNQLDISIYTKLSKSGGIMTGNLDMNNKRIYYLAQPNGNNQPATKTYVDTHFLAKSGAVMAGDLSIQ